MFWYILALIFVFSCNIETVFLIKCNGKSSSQCIEIGGEKHCFFRCTDAVSWEEARIGCRSQAAVLAAVSSRQTQNIVTKLLNSTVNTAWLGGKTQPLTFKWIYNRKGPGNFDNWADKKPDPNLAQKCLMVNSKLQWSDASCEDWRKVICRKDTRWKHHFAEGNIFVIGHYAICPAKSWEDAVLTCHKYQSKLLELQTQQQIDDLRLFNIHQQFDYAWLAASRLQWTWVTQNDTNVPIENNYWANETFGYPFENQCMLQESGVSGWSATGCQRKHSYICQQVSASGQTTHHTTITVTSTPPPGGSSNKSAVYAAVIIVLMLFIIPAITATLFWFRRHYLMKISAQLSSPASPVSEDISLYSGPGGVYCGPQYEKQVSNQQTNRQSDINKDSVIVQTTDVYTIPDKIVKS